MMRTHGSTILLVTLVLLAGAAVAALLADGPAQARADARHVSFQRLVGGLGFGPSVELGPCALGFDPRLGCTCQQDHGPIPAGAWFCPQHACSVFYYPPVRGQARQEK